MADYKLQIQRDGNLIFDVEIDSDAVIEVMHSFVKAGVVELTHDKPIPKPKYRRVASPIKGRSCGNCGIKGHRRDSCPTLMPLKSDTIKRPENGLKRQLTSDEFEEAKIMQDEEHLSTEVARRFGISLVDVNKIFSSASYEEYKS